MAYCGSCGHFLASTSSAGGLGPRPLPSWRRLLGIACIAAVGFCCGLVLFVVLGLASGPAPRPSKPIGLWPAGRYYTCKTTKDGREICKFSPRGLRVFAHMVREDFPPRCRVPDPRSFAIEELAPALLHCS